MRQTGKECCAVAVLLTVAGAFALAGMLAAPARADRVTREQLQAHGWICYPPPGGIDRIVCFDPGVGRPFPGNPDPAPSYNFLLFTASSGEFLFTGHFIRADLYSGQRCGNEPYVFRGLIGYWECPRLTAETDEMTGTRGAGDATGRGRPACGLRLGRTPRRGLERNPVDEGNPEHAGHAHNLPATVPARAACYSHAGTGAVSDLGAVSQTYVNVVDTAPPGCPAGSSPSCPPRYV
jgi:hypothetical protein